MITQRDTSDAERTLYVVVATAGRCSCREYRLVRAFPSREQAEALVVDASNRMRERVGAAWKKHWLEIRALTEYDPATLLAYEPISYYVTDVDLA